MGKSPPSRLTPNRAAAFFSRASHANQDVYFAVVLLSGEYALEHPRPQKRPWDREKDLSKIFRALDMVWPRRVIKSHVAGLQHGFFPILLISTPQQSHAVRACRHVTSMVSLARKELL